MKKTIIRCIILIATIILLFTSCAKFLKKDKEGERDEFYNKNQSIIENKVYAYQYIKDVGKSLKEVKNTVQLQFGDKITTLDNVEVDDKTYYRIKASNNKEYWLNRSAVAQNIVVISVENFKTYQYPDENSITEILLMPGDLGIVREERGDWFKISFWAYRPHTPGGPRDYVGDKWIKKNKKMYVNDVSIVKEAYFLYLAYYYLHVDSGHDKNISDFFKGQGLRISSKSGQESFVTNLLKDF